MFYKPVSINSSEAGAIRARSVFCWLGRVMQAQEYDIDDMVEDSSPTIGEDVFCPVLGHSRWEEKVDYYV